MVDAGGYARVEQLNGECNQNAIDRAALQQALQAQGADWHDLVQERCPFLFAAAPVFITQLQLQQMRAVIAAVEEVVGAPEPHFARGVFYGYDFHVDAGGVHLIEINTNAGGAFLVSLLAVSQQGVSQPGTVVADENLEQVFIQMLRNEWQQVRGDAPLKTIAIVDEQPESQYLYPEFLLAKKWFERAGLAVHIADPAALQAQEDGLYCAGQRIDLIYNRLTDFDLQKYSTIRLAWEKHQVVLTPNPAHYRHYADKRKLALLTDANSLDSIGISSTSVDALLQGIPQTKAVRAEDAAMWWAERKQWFFKPVNGYGGKGAYRGEKLTKRVFEEIMQSDYVAQRLALPAERTVCVAGAEPASLKFDVRCYVYDGHIQLVAARLYQGQTTNFRTPGGGFALVRVID